MVVVVYRSCMCAMGDRRDRASATVAVQRTANRIVAIVGLSTARRDRRRRSCCRRADRARARAASTTTTVSTGRERERAEPIRELPWAGPTAPRRPYTLRPSRRSRSSAALIAAHRRRRGRARSSAAALAATTLSP